MPRRCVQRWREYECLRSLTRARGQMPQRRGIRQRNLQAFAGARSFGVPLRCGKRIPWIGIAIAAPQEHIGWHALYSITVKLRLRDGVVVGSCHEVQRLSLKGSMRRASSSNCSATVLSADVPPVVRARRASLRHDAACSRSSSAASERVGCCIRPLAEPCWTA